MEPNKIIFNYQDYIQKEKYEIYIKNEYNTTAEQYVNRYIIRFNNGVIFEFIPEFEKELDNYTISKPIQIDYILHIIDDQNLRESKYNIKLKYLNRILWIYSINYKQGYKRYKNKYWFQILCQKYLKDLIENYSEIFELLFKNKIDTYKIKIKRKIEFPWNCNKNNFEMLFNDYVNYREDKQPFDDIEEYFVSQNEIINLTTDHEFIFKNKTTLKSYYNNQCKIYNILSTEDILEKKDIILYNNSDNNYLYHKHIEYIISLKNENKNYFVYNDNNVICYYGISYKIHNLVKLNKNIILIDVGNYNFPNESILKDILKLEFEDYSEINKYIIGHINDI